MSKKLADAGAEVNEENLSLLLSKGAFPYTWFKSHKRLSAKELPPKKEWYDTLSDKHISRETFAKASIACDDVPVCVASLLFVCFNSIGSSQVLEVFVLFDGKGLNQKFTAPIPLPTSSTGSFWLLPYSRGKLSFFFFFFFLGEFSVAYIKKSFFSVACHLNFFFSVACTQKVFSLL